MSQYLPYSGFKWLNRGKVDNFDVNSVGENSPTGYILEVDLEYPDELHALHNDYPLAPKRLEIIHNMLSNYCNSIGKKYDIKTRGFNKLIKVNMFFITEIFSCIYH